MIENPHPFLRRPNEKAQKHWWHKIKAILFGQWLIARENSHKLDDDSYPFTLKVNQVPVSSSLKEWFEAIDVLQPLVQSVRSSIEPQTMNDFNIEILGVNTYLFHLDRILVKIREHLLNFRFRQEQNSEELHSKDKLDLRQASEAAEHCFHTILHLTALIQRLPLKKLYSEEFISQIHALELDATSLASSMRSLNQTAYKAQAMVELAALEQDLLHTLAQSRSPMGGGASFADMGLNQGMMYTAGEYLRSKVHNVTSPEFNHFITGMIDIHEMLKKCYVVARKAVVKESLDVMGDNIEGLIVIVSQTEIDRNRAFYHLDQLFHCIESLRFNTNRESRCSKNLFEKSKCARHQLRKICQKNELGIEYLKKYSIKRVTILKPPK